MSLYVLYLQYLLLKSRFGSKVQLPGVHHAMAGWLLDFLHDTLEVLGREAILNQIRAYVYINVDIYIIIYIYVNVIQRIIGHAIAHHEVGDEDDHKGHTHNTTYICVVYFVLYIGCMPVPLTVESAH